MSATAPVAKKKDRPSAVAVRATIASTVGSVLEWIDFTLYGALTATIFPKIFFSSLDPAMGLLAAFVTFGVGFFARPLGGLFFGAVGDRIGRKRVLQYTLALMGMASFLIGCLPTYADVGIAAPIALVALRFLQGFALGGEATGAQLLTIEHAPPGRRGLFGSFINTGSSLSAVAANAILFTLTALLGEEIFAAWGWRVPFLCSIVLVALGLYIRRKVGETPSFEQALARKETRKLPMFAAFRQYPGTILRLIVIWCAPASCFYVINVFSLSYITRNLGLESSTAFLCLMGANVFAVFAVIGGGLASDLWGRRPMMLLSSAGMLLAALAFFPLLDSKNWIAIFLAMAFFICALQIQSGIQPAFFSEPFPTSVRYSGSAAAYTGANLIAGGPTPFIAAWLLERAGGDPWVITALCVGLIVCAMVGLWLSPETRDLDMNR